MRFEMNEEETMINIELVDQRTGAYMGTQSWVKNNNAEFLFKSLKRIIKPDKEHLGPALQDALHQLEKRITEDALFPWEDFVREVVKDEMIANFILSRGVLKIIVGVDTNFEDMPY
jgi:hypothetical protein